MSEFSHLQRFKSVNKHGTPIGQIIGFDAHAHKQMCDGGAKRPKILLFDNIDDLKQDWLRLQREPHVMVHQTYQWCRTWAGPQHAKTLFIALKTGHQIDCILPLEIKSVCGCTLAHLIGTAHSNGNFPLASRAFLQTCGPDFMNWLAGQLAQIKLPFDAILLDRMRQSSLGEKNVFFDHKNIQNQNSSYQLHLSEDFEASLQPVSAKKRRKEFRKTHNKLMQLGGYEFCQATTSQEIDRALNSFLKLKSQRFARLGIPDVFAAETIQKSFRSLAHLSERDIGRLQLHYIKIAGGEFTGKLLAVAATTTKHGHMICHFNAFDEDIGSQNNASPGILLFHLLIKKACGDGVTLFDLGIGDQRYKRSLTNIETHHYDRMVSLNLRGYALSFTFGMRTRLKRAIKSSDTVLLIARRLRHVFMQ